MLSDLKNSRLLDTILEYAKTFDQRGGVTLTAERYLLSVIDAVSGTAHLDIGKEDKDRLFRVLRQAFPADGGEFAKTRNTLLTHIQGTGSASYMDGLYLQQRSYNAKNLAAGRGEKEVPPDILLECIFKEPDAFIKQIMSGQLEGDWQSGEDPNRRSAPETKAEAAPAEKPVQEEPAAEQAEMDRLILMENLTQNVRAIRDQLSEAVFGQENAIDVFVSGYFQSQLGTAIQDKTRPAGTFLFAGPPGVGKTFLVKNIVKALGKEKEFMCFNMSEYADNLAHMALVGHDENYKSPKEGLLTGFVKRHPQCVLLFDEIEKAHMNTIHLFLQILDEGVLTDSKTNQQVSFKDALIFFTTNAGRQLYDGSDAHDFSGVSRKVILRALQQDVNPQTREPYFPAAICSRFASGNVVMFNHMSASSLCRIARTEIEKRAAAYEKQYGIQFRFDPDVFTALLFAEGAGADARTLRGRAAKFFDTELLELFRLLSSDEHEGRISDLNTIRVGVELPSDPEILSLFKNTDSHDVLVYSSADTADRWEKRCQNVRMIPAEDLESAKSALKSNPVEFAVIDLLYGAHEERRFMNIEDMHSVARDLFRFIRGQHGDLPIYILQHSGAALTREEQKSFLRDGVRGFITTDGQDVGIAGEMDRICSEMYQQASMRKLAASNNLVTYESGQRVVDGGKTAEIVLFDFELSTAVDAEDTRNIMSNVSKPNVRFSDIIGAETAKEELRFFIEYLKDPRQFADSGLRAPRGVLLYGPPGTGKTMLAKAVACEAGVTFISAEGNQFLKRYVGEGKDDLHNLFAVARKYAPTILFIDEFEAIAKERRGGEHSYATGEDVLTALLTEMDGFHTDISRPVFVLAATNFDVTPGSGKSLDQALLRRFDSKICVDLPSREERIRFLQMKRRGNSALAITDGEIESIALRSTGMSLSDLHSVLELALRTAIRQADKKVTDQVLDEAFETFTGGEKKSWDASELERTARHEAGHTFLCWYGGEDPTYVTVVARGNYGGYMQQGSDEGKGLYTREELLAKIRTSLGGRAAETVYYGEKEGASTGASGDLAAATRLARQIICTYGMDDQFGLAVIDQQAAQNGEISLKVRDAVNGILEREMKEAVRIIGENRACIDALAERLMNENHLNGEGIRQVFEQNGGVREKT